ncbi:methyltransferase [Candidatus Woesearchaeota archaeon]|nr:methyltransferase [Candidatus Woesearchaeota archaeon]
MGVYEPAEDSLLLAAAVEKYAFGNVLDIGTGSGIQAITAAKKKEVKSVAAADINAEALRFAEAAAAKEGVRGKITFLKSDLFSSIKGKFDTIIFNPPYLPQDKGIFDEAIYGGKHGYEVLQRFIGCCNSYLKDGGIALIVFSSLTNRQKVDEAIEKSCMEYEETGQKHISFEALYTYAIRKSSLLRQLEQKGISCMALFAKGNRGVIYKGSCRGKTVAVKAQRKGTMAVANVENEANWLKLLNKEGIGPKLLLTGKDWFAYWFVEGKFIVDFIISCKEKKKIAAVIRALLLQARKLDKLKVNKEEMSRPQKHAIIGKGGKVTMIDFERCHKTPKPKNVTQLCQFLAHGYANALLRQKGIAIESEKLLAAAKDYKHGQTDKNFKRILKLVS